MQRAPVMARIVELASEEASSVMRAFAGACCSGTYLYSQCVPKSRHSSV